jgi:hypothetical protein
MKTNPSDSYRTGIGSSPNVLVALHERLLSLPYDAYLQVISQLLSRLGYRDVRPSGRTDWKGRNKGGGYDIVASLSDVLHSRTVIVSAKQFDRASRIFQRQVDELRGAAIRSGANEALLITSGSLSDAIDPKVLVSPFFPVRLMDGDELISLLIQYGIGITDSFGLDEAFFAKLEQEAIGNRQSDCVTSSDIVLTVSLNRVPKYRHDPVPKNRSNPLPKRGLPLPTERRYVSKLRRLSKSG